MEIVKDSNAENLEYIFLTQNQELWEIDYNKGHAIDITEINRKKLSELNALEYGQTIVEFLTKERGCQNIHFHDSMNFQTRIHLTNSKTIHHNNKCTFQKST